MPLFPACPWDWTGFGLHCYRLLVEDDPLTWLAAQTRCRQLSAYLVSIGSRTEMVFLHYMLTTQWLKNDTLAFIGNLPAVLWKNTYQGKISNVFIINI